MSHIAGMFHLHPADPGPSSLSAAPGAPDDAALKRIEVHPRLTLWSRGRVVLTEQSKPLQLLAGVGELRRSDGRGFEALAGDSGTDALAALRGARGPFAFALFHAADETLTLCRDALGLKTLYLCALPDRVAFATEIKWLLPLLPHRPQLDPRALAQFVQYSFSGGRETALRGIERVLPGEAVRVGSDLRLTRDRFWSLAGAPAEDGGRCEEAARSFDRLFETVLREHAASAGRYGLLLSGGLDSGILCAALAERQATPLQTFSVGYDVPTKHDELGEARRIARLFGTRHTELRLSLPELQRRIPFMVWGSDELMDDPASLSTSLAADRIGRQVGTIFTGEGADEVFAGDGAFRQTALQRWLANLAAPGSGGFRTKGLWNAGTRRRLLAGDLMEASADNRREFIAAWRAAPRDWSPIQRAQFLELEVFAPNSLIPKVERPLGQAGLDLRMPFLDPRIVAFGLALPDRLKVHSRHGKYFLRKWAAHRLPADHVMQKKRGFAVPITRMLSDDFLARLQTVLPASRAIREWFRPQEVAELVATQRQHRNITKQVWRLMVFAIWHTMFIELPGVLPGLNENPLDWII